MKSKVVIALVLVLLLLLVQFVPLYTQYSREMAHAYQRIGEGSHVLATEHGEVEYTLEGQGTPVLLIHGAGGGYDQGLLMGQAFLGTGYQFVAVSRFGYLGSSLPEEATVEKQAALYSELLDHLGIDQVVVMGVSAGGPSAAQFAHDYPERSRGLILASAVSMYMGDHIPVSTKIVNAIQKSDFAYWLVIKTFRTQFLGLIGIPEETYASLEPDEKAFANDMLEMMHPMSPRRPGNLHEANIKPLSGEEMSTVTVPAIIVHAQDDTLVSYDHALFYQAHLANARLVSYDSGGHGMASELKEIREELRTFLVNLPL